MKIDQKKLKDDDVMLEIKHKDDPHTAIIRGGKIVGWSCPKVVPTKITSRTKWAWLHKDIQK